MWPRRVSFLAPLLLFLFDLRHESARRARILARNHDISLIARRPERHSRLRAPSPPKREMTWPVRQERRSLRSRRGDIPPERRTKGRLSVSCGLSAACGARLSLFRAGCSAFVRIIRTFPVRAKKRARRRIVRAAASLARPSAKIHDVKEPRANLSAPLINARDRKIRRRFAASIGCICASLFARTGGARPRLQRAYFFASFCVCARLRPESCVLRAAAFFFAGRAASRSRRSWRSFSVFSRCFSAACRTSVSATVSALVRAALFEAIDDLSAIAAPFLSEPKKNAGLVARRSLYG